jgi:uncharacterized protein (TIGR03435 family)
LFDGTPAWVTSAGFDVDARADGPATGAQLKRMLQTLLAERFGLRFHYETREMPGFALVVAKNGPKLKDVSQNRPAGRLGGVLGGALGSGGSLTDHNMSLSTLAGFLSRKLDKPIIDKTELKGTYDITLTWTPGNTFGSPGSAGVADSTGRSLLKALEEQIGLQLEEQNVPIQVLVIDHVEKPSGD